MGIFAIAILTGILFIRYQLETRKDFNFVFFYAPLFIFAILILFNLYKMTIFKRVMMVLGDTSVYMWFVHALFFTPILRSFYQPYIHISGNFIIIIFGHIL